LTGAAWLSDGQNEIRGNTLIYDIGRERVQANPNEKDPGGVHITIKPKPKPASPGTGPTATPSAAAKPAAPSPAAATDAGTGRMSRLRAESLGKSYRSRRVVKDLSLEVASGEVVGLLGPNGAGKTTAFYMIVGLVPCDEGRIHLDDKEVTRLPMYRRAQLGVGYLPQEASVFRKLSVEDNILAILETRKDLDGEEDREAALEALLDELHIGHIRGSSGMSLSGGERRRVEIARALAAEPRFILLDEPFAGVDPLSVVDIQRIIRHLSARNIGVLITDHNVRETLGICSRAYIVSAGSVIASGSAEEILANPQGA
jgi:lipopolysaccharide export system ATP-binding protein